MYLEEFLINFLIADEYTSSICGGRVFPNKIPQLATLPAVVIHKISGLRHYTHSGPIGLVSPRFQVDTVAETYGDAKELGEAIRSCIEGYQGVMGPYLIQGIFVAEEHDTYNPPIHADDVGLHVTITDYFIWYIEVTQNLMTVGTQVSFSWSNFLEVSPGTPLEDILGDDVSLA